jgi:hypothetical protein
LLLVLYIHFNKYLSKSEVVVLKFSAFTDETESDCHFRLPAGATRLWVSWFHCEMQNNVALGGESTQFQPGAGK